MLNFQLVRSGEVAAGWALTMRRKYALVEKPGN